MTDYDPLWRDRCDWCGWPLVSDKKSGCVAGDCSHRPRPIRADTQIRQDCRKAEQQLDDAKELATHFEKAAEDAEARVGYEELENKIIAQDEEIERLEEDVSDYKLGLGGDTLDPDFQPCCGIVWEEDQHKETCKHYCRICKGHNEDCECGMLISLNQAVEQGIKKVRRPHWDKEDGIEILTDGTTKVIPWVRVIQPSTDGRVPMIRLGTVGDWDKEEWERYE